MLEPKYCGRILRNGYTEEYDLKRKQLLVDLACCLGVVTLLLLVFFFGGCSEMYVKGGGNARQATAIEQVLTWNAALADANLGIAKGIIAANEAGEIDVPTSNAILTQQSLIADADRQLTPILAKACSPQKQIQACNPAILSGDAAAIENFLDQIRASASTLVKSGTAGIKNPTRKQTVDQAIQDVYTLMDKLVEGLQQLGVVKVKTATMACQVFPDGMPVSVSSASMVCAMGAVTFTYGTGRACPFDGQIVCLADVKR